MPSANRTYQRHSWSRYRQQLVKIPSNACNALYVAFSIFPTFLDHAQLFCCTPTCSPHFVSGYIQGHYCTRQQCRCLWRQNSQTYQILSPLGVYLHLRNVNHVCALYHSEQDPSPCKKPCATFACLHFINARPYHQTFRAWQLTHSKSAQ